ncbi:MAG: TraI domain-containing protein [Pseudomonas sp.]|nr:TraI domain-containing protein [Pseudomonas sp.]
MFKKSPFKIKKNQFYYRGQPYLFTAGLSDGIPAFPAELILQHEHIETKINLIRGMCPLKEPEFDQLILPVIKLAVRHMHLLPATEGYHNREVMGLLKHSLDTAYRAQIRAKSEEWDDGLAVHWQIAAMLAGMLKDIGVAYENLWVQRISDGYVWDCKEPLADWLSDSATQSYNVCWRVGRVVKHDQLSQSLQLAETIISEQLQDFLEPVWQGFCVALSAQGSRNRNKLQKIINQANWGSVARSIAAYSDAALSLGSMPPAWFQYLSMIEILVLSGVLSVNQPDSAVFITHELGVMLDLYKISERSRKSGVPAQISQQLRFSSDVRKALDVMNKLIPWERPCGEAVYYWDINLHLEVEGEQVKVNCKAIRLNRMAGKIFSVDMHQPVNVEVNLLSSKSKGIA